MGPYAKIWTCGATSLRSTLIWRERRYLWRCNMKHHVRTADLLAGDCGARRSWDGKAMPLNRAFYNMLCVALFFFFIFIALNGAESLGGWFHLRKVNNLVVCRFLQRR